jgi:hypothetical protein
VQNSKFNPVQTLARPTSALISAPRSKTPKVASWPSPNCVRAENCEVVLNRIARLLHHLAQLVVQKLTTLWIASRCALVSWSFERAVRLLNHVPKQIASDSR